MSTHLALPVRWTGTRLGTVERGTLADVHQSVAMLLDTIPGERLSIRDYGLNDPTFTTVSGQVLAAAAVAQEPRADVEVTTEDGRVGVRVSLAGDR